MLDGRMYRYRLVVKGELGPRYASDSEGMTFHSHDGETDIVGPITDRAHVLAMLQRIAGLGLTLRSLTQLETGAAVADGSPQNTTNRGKRRRPWSSLEGNVNA